MFSRAFRRLHRAPGLVEGLWPALGVLGGGVGGLGFRALVDFWWSFDMENGKFDRGISGNVLLILTFLTEHVGKASKFEIIGDSLGDPACFFLRSSRQPSSGAIRQDTEMQVVIVGAGRADLVAQTKVGWACSENTSRVNESSPIDRTCGKCCEMLRIYIYICMYVYVYIYICICICMCICICICICPQPESLCL